MLYVLGQPLATIDFQFLQQLENLKGWNNSLYDIFKWIEKKEGKLNKKVYIFLVNGDTVFTKIEEDKIGIYQNLFSFNLEEKKQYIIICGKNEFDQSGEFIKLLSESLLKFLEEKRIKYRLVYERSARLSKNGFILDEIIEVLIGANSK